MFERGIRLLVAFSVHCCIHTDTHMYVCLLPRTGQTLKRLFVNTGQKMQLKRVFVEIWHEGYGALFVIETSKALPAPLSLHSLAVVMNPLPDFPNRSP